jgi:hypothetical protein
MQGLLASLCLLLGTEGSDSVQVVRQDDQRKVEVLVDGRPFTSYRWSGELAKPVLWPIRTAVGQVITRGFPLEPRPGESDDHPHHVGLWFSYGNVDGVDFWGNAGRFGVNLFRRRGSIVHRGIDHVRSGPKRGELTVRADWLKADGTPVVREVSQYVFGAGPGRRSIDRVVTLASAGRSVDWLDNKEGLLALRLGPALEHPGPDNPGASGQYRSSEGRVGEQVWGTRARWMMLTGKLEGRPVTVAILDHPANPGYPTYWHARGYGLFAANPLGQDTFSKGREKLGFSLPAGHRARFAYRVLILSGHATPDDIEAESRRFGETR